MKKKGDLLPEETLKIILAIIGISLLVYLAVSLYGIFIKDTKLEQAEASLGIIYSKIKSVESEEDNLNFLIESPKDWWIVAWERNEKPVKCKGSYCICICPENSLIECDNKGVCKDFSVQIAHVALKIEKPIYLEVFLSESKIIIKESSGGEFGGGGASGAW